MKNISLVMITLMVMLGVSFSPTESARQAEAPREPGVVARQVWADAEAVFTHSPSPDGKFMTFVYLESGNLAVRNLEAGTSRMLTDDGTLNPPAQFALNSRWSPDGKRIAFTSTRDGNYDIYLMDLDGQLPIPALVSPQKESKPAWFPNGTLAFVQERTLRGRPAPVVVRHQIAAGTAPCRSGRACGRRRRDRWRDTSSRWRGPGTSGHRSALCCGPWRAA